MHINLKMFKFRQRNLKMFKFRQSKLKILHIQQTLFKETFNQQDLQKEWTIVPFLENQFKILIEKKEEHYQTKNQCFIKEHSQIDQMEIKSVTNVWIAKIHFNKITKE